MGKAPLTKVVHEQIPANAERVSRFPRVTVQNVRVEEDQFGRPRSLREGCPFQSGRSGVSRCLRWGREHQFWPSHSSVLIVAAFSQGRFANPSLHAEVSKSFHMSSNATDSSRNLAKLTTAEVPMS